MHKNIENQEVYNSKFSEILEQMGIYDSENEKNETQDNEENNESNNKQNQSEDEQEKN